MRYKITVFVRQKRCFYTMKAVVLATKSGALAVHPTFCVIT